MAQIDTIADRSTGSAIAGKAYFETSTNKFIVFNGTAWIELDSDGVGAVYENRWGASFDGTNDYIQLPNGVLTALSGTAYTISAWYNLDIVGYYPMIFSATNNLQVYFRPRDPQVGLELWVNGSSRIIQNTPYSSVGSWVHGCISVDTTGTSTMYINGSSNASSSSVPQVTSISNPVIGSQYGAGYFLNGYVEDVAVFDAALSAADVTKIYNGTAPNGKPTDLTLAASYDTDRTSNLKGYWRMGDDSNDTAVVGGSIATITDSSGNGNDATQSTASNQPTFKALALSTTSLSFDGSSDYLEKTFSSAPLAGAYTIGFWFNTSTTPTWLSLFESTDNTANYNGGFRVYRQGDGHIRLVSATVAGTWQVEVSTPSAVTSENVWHHVVFTRSAHGATPEVYVDGVVPSGTSYGTAMSEVISSTKLRIGSTYAGGLTGYMDEVSFFNSELTGSDLTAYLSAVRGTHLINDLSLSPTAYWRMGEDDSLTDGASASQISDASGNGNHATQAAAANQPTASVTPVIYV